jgi:hypothetical protein
LDRTPDCNGNPDVVAQCLVYFDENEYANLDEHEYAYVYEYEHQHSHGYEYEYQHSHEYEYSLRYGLDFWNYDLRVVHSK